jgi:hypothetical protein
VYIMCYIIQHYKRFMKVIKFNEISNFISLSECTKKVNEAIFYSKFGVDRIQFDWSSIRFLDPAFLVIMGSMIQFIGKTSETRMHVIWPNDLKARQYLSNIGFDELFVSPESRIAPKIMADYIKLQFLRVEHVTEIAQFFERHLPTGIPDLYYSVEQSLSELMDNVMVHSGSPIGGCLSGQYLPNIHRIRFALCDFGVSIPAHLSRKPTYEIGYDDEHLIREAFEEGISGGNGRTGAGLSVARDFTMKIGGMVRTYSRNGAYTIRSNDVIVTPSEIAFPGTIHTIDWPSKIRGKSC